MNTKRGKIISSLTLALILFGVATPFQGLVNVSAKEVKQTKLEGNSNTAFTIENAKDNKFQLANIEVKNLKYKIININLQGNLKLSNSSINKTYVAKTVTSDDEKDISLILKSNATSSSTVKTLLSTIRFMRIGSEYPTGAKINIDAETEVVARLIDENGVKHYYYRYQIPQLAWNSAYTRAKEQNLRGLKGYLTTVTSEKEQKFIGEATYDGSGAAPYFVGGTRAIIEKTGEKINDEDSLIGLFGINLTDLDNKKVQYYWADGPETGKVFWNSIDIKDQKGDVGEYTDWGRLGSSTSVGYLYAGNGMLGDRYQWLSEASSNFIPSTPMVEFSEYKGQKENIEDSEATVPDELKEGQVVEHYVDAEGHKIVDDAVISGNVGDSYTAEQKDLTSKGYDFDRLANGSAPVEGKITEETQEVILVYKAKEEKVGKVVTKYVDESGKELSNQEVIVGYIGDEYVTEKKNLIEEGLNYKFLKMADNSAPVEGVITENQQNVVYVYRALTPQEKGRVIARYVDENNKDLIDPKITEGNVGSAYKTEKKNLIEQGLNYKFLKMADNSAPEKGKYTKDDQTVIYVYRSTDANNKKAADVHYVDENGKDIAPAKEFSGNVGDTYNVGKAMTIQGYEYKKVDETGDAPTGVIEAGVTKHVRYIYEGQINNQALIIRYVNQQDNDLVAEEHRPGKIGDTYTTEQKDFTKDGYKFVKLAEDSAPANGTITDEIQIVTYVYQGDYVEKAAKVMYVDESGKEIAKEKEFSGNIGDIYDVDAPITIRNYTYKKLGDNSDIPTGYIIKTERIVIYVYSQNN